MSPAITTNQKDRSTLYSYSFFRLSYAWSEESELLE